jgi:hypothetical protein
MTNQRCHPERQRRICCGFGWFIYKNRFLLRSECQTNAVILSGSEGSAVVIPGIRPVFITMVLALVGRLIYLNFR